MLKTERDQVFVRIQREQLQKEPGQHHPATSSRNDATRWGPDCHKTAPEAGGKRRCADCCPALIRPGRSPHGPSARLGEVRAPLKALRPRDRPTVHSVSPIYSGLASGQRHLLARASESVQRMLRHSCVAAKAIVQGRAFGTHPSECRAQCQGSLPPRPVGTGRAHCKGGGSPSSLYYVLAVRKQANCSALNAYQYMAPVSDTVFTRYSCMHDRAHRMSSMLSTSSLPSMSDIERGFRCTACATALLLPASVWFGQVVTVWSIATFSPRTPVKPAG